MAPWAGIASARGLYFLRPRTEYSGRTLVFAWDRALGRVSGLVALGEFWGFFWEGGGDVGAGRWAIILLGFEIFLMGPNFLNPKS